ncbi:MAG: DUF3147 family protein, partial [Acidobacteriaceae bacterium]|nr:DUF3147 family protein [Acidobacteriaceae bacterium]
QLNDIKPREIGMRFLFGGACTVAAYLIARHFGPAVGGLFLAFPAIFPASASLIEKHEKSDKATVGSDGTERGRLAAGLDAAGTAMGCIGLMGFALVVWQALPLQGGQVALAEASLAWLALAVTVWLLRVRRKDATNPN